MSRMVYSKSFPCVNLSYVDAPQYTRKPKIWDLDDLVDYLRDLLIDCLDRFLFHCVHLQCHGALKKYHD